MQSLDVKNLLLEQGAGLRRDLTRHTIRDVIAEKLAALIASGVMTVGDELPSERELAAALSVSRATVRGAIQTLAAHGILTVTQGARTSVATTDLGSMAVRLPNRRSIENYDLESVHAARLLIERNVAGDAAEQISDKTLAQLENSLVAQDTCLTDPVRFLICDREFHVTIYRACGNQLLADIATDLYTYLLEYRRRIVSQPGSVAASIADHRAIVAALLARDRDAAVAAFGAHEMRIYESTRHLLTKSVKDAT